MKHSNVEGLKVVAPPTVSILGVVPSAVAPKKLQEVLGRENLTPEEIIALLQNLVSQDLRDFAEAANQGLEQSKVVWEKNKSGIGRGHAMDGLLNIAFLIHGSKMLDSALSGVVYSRTLGSSSRRKTVTMDDIYVPESIANKSDLLEIYMEANAFAFRNQAAITEQYGNSVFNKIRPYNETCDMLYVVPLSSLALLTMECKYDEAKLLPIELHDFVAKLPALLGQVGMADAYNLRCAVPRAGYKHYHPFKPASGKPSHMLAHAKDCRNNRMLKKRIRNGAISIKGPLDDATKSFIEDLRKLEAANSYIRGNMMNMTAAEHREAALKMAYERWQLCSENNAAIKLTTCDAVSWRVWSEQKRHGTLDQYVESIYHASNDAAARLIAHWLDVSPIQTESISCEAAEEVRNCFQVDADNAKSTKSGFLAEQAILVYLNAWARLRAAGVPERDALFCVPRALILATREEYDALNLFCLELPLRLCSTCEAERLHSSRDKVIAIEEVAFGSGLLGPKCSCGMCTEAKFCKNILYYVPNYNQERHLQLHELLESL